jgi:hypothetical protein
MESAGVKVWECAQTISICGRVGHEVAVARFTPRGEKAYRTWCFADGAGLVGAVVSAFENNA